MTSPLKKHRVVLLGVGHTNAHILRMWRMQPISDCELVCVSNHLQATYSGMMPGVLAGQYDRDAMQIDLVRLTAAAHARLVHANPTRIDRERRELLFGDERAPLAYDYLSIGIGSVPKLPPVGSDSPSFVTIKPMQTFLDRLERRLRQWKSQDDTSSPVQIVVVGGGAGGVEIALCIPPFIRSIIGDRDVHVSLVSAAARVPVGSRPRTNQLVENVLKNRGVTLHKNTTIVSVQENSVVTREGMTISADVVIWAPSATAPPLLASLDLMKDAQGFLFIRPTLQSVEDDRIFAVGDTGSLQAWTTPKAGVYAVRQGPILWTNLQRITSGQPLSIYTPQRDFLKLINTGDGRSVGEYRSVSWLGKSAWRLKNHIDTKFMRMFHDYSPMPMTKSAMADNSHTSNRNAMRCTGCGCKVAGDVLQAVLGNVAQRDQGHVAIGLDNPDDAAVLETNGAAQIVISTDFFTAPLTDLYLVGRLAAQHALSDIYAMNAVPTTALAMIGVPSGDGASQQRTLSELMAGSMHELSSVGVTLAGGHTIEQDSLMIGFTVVGAPRGEGLRTKGGLQQGNELVLTKPLGTGVLLAAHALAECHGDWYLPLLQSMLRSNRDASESRWVGEASAMTDVTGFGLAGHLLEMLNASKETSARRAAATSHLVALSAEIWLDQIAYLPGALALSQSGRESSLAPGNRHIEGKIVTNRETSAMAEYRLLFDPQTSGGLLVGLPAGAADRYVQDLRAQGQWAAVIGRVIASSQQEVQLRVCLSRR